MLYALQESKNEIRQAITIPDIDQFDVPHVSLKVTRTRDTYFFFSYRRINISFKWLHLSNKCVNRISQLLFKNIELNTIGLFVG